MPIGLRHRGRAQSAGWPRGPGGGEPYVLEEHLAAEFICELSAGETALEHAVT